MLFRNREDKQLIRISSNIADMFPNKTKNSELLKKHLYAI